MQWSKKAKEIMQNECIDFGMDLEQNVYKTFDEINKLKIKNGLEPKKRITRDIVEQTILNIINDTPPGGDIQNKEKEIFTSLGKIYTGEKRKRETLEKKNNRDGEKRNTISYGNERFLWGGKNLFFNILPISLFLKTLSRLFLSLFPTHNSTYFSPSLFFPFELGLCFKNLFSRENLCHVSFYKPWSFFGNMHACFLRKSKGGFHFVIKFNWGDFY